VPPNGSSSSFAGDLVGPVDARALDSRSEGDRSEMMYTALYMPSTRTQIYLTEEQRRGLDERGHRTGAPLARMIREAVDIYLADDGTDPDAALDATFGSLPELELPSRDEWDVDASPGR
jgi:hypothetical protein